MSLLYYFGNYLTRYSFDRAKFLLFAYSIILIYFRNKVNRCVENSSKYWRKNLQKHSIRHIINLYPEDVIRMQIVNSEESEVCMMIEMKRTIVTEYRMATSGSEF